MKSIVEKAKKEVIARTLNKIKRNKNKYLKLDIKDSDFLIGLGVADTLGIKDSTLKEL